MAKQFNFTYSAPPIGLIPPQAGGSTITSPYKSLRNSSGKVAVVVHINQGNAATVAVALLQAQNESGGGSKAIGSGAANTAGPPTFYNASTTTGDAFTAEGYNTSFTTDASLADKFVVFEFDPADVMDVNNTSGTFNHIAVQVSGSNASNIIEAHMEYLGRFQQAAPPASEV